MDDQGNLFMFVRTGYHREGELEKEYNGFFEEVVVEEVPVQVEEQPAPEVRVEPVVEEVPVQLEPAYDPDFITDPVDDEDEQGESLSCPYCGDKEFLQLGIEYYMCITCKNRFLNTSDIKPVAAFSASKASSEQPVVQTTPVESVSVEQSSKAVTHEVTKPSAEPASSVAYVEPTSPSPAPVALEPVAEPTSSVSTPVSTKTTIVKQPVLTTIV